MAVRLRMTMRKLRGHMMIIERLDDYELLCEEDILGKEQPF